MKTCCEYTDKIMWVSSDQRRIINRVLKLADQYPDDVSIIKYPADNDRCIYASVPAEWLKINPPPKREISEEQKAIMVERLKNARANRPES